jgi:transposase
MFLKPTRRRRDGKSQTYWKLVESYRSAQGPRHRTVAYLGELSAGEKSGWAQLKARLNGKPNAPSPPRLFHRPPPTEPVPETVEVNVRQVRVENQLDFGDVYLAWRVWRMLGLAGLLDRHLPVGRAQAPWSLVATVLCLARFCEPSSELHVAEHWYRRTCLPDLLGVGIDQIGKDRLYRCHDRLLELKPRIEAHLKEQFTTLFDASYELLLYDVTSTYFEGLAEGNPQAKRGYSRDQRPDCKQVCIGLVVTGDGLPVGYEVFDGNRNDATTVEQIVEQMEQRHGRAKRIWVLDRGMINESNLQFIRDRRGCYIVGTPKASLKAYESKLLEASDWTQVQAGLEVKLCPGPDGEETFILCRSAARRQKEQAMHERFEQRIEAGLQSLARRLEKAKKPVDRTQVERQIGRLLGGNSRAAGLFDIRVETVKQDGGERLAVSWTRRERWRQWAALSEGCYMLRTNLTDWPAEKLWRTYIQLTEAEAAFRVHKSDLALRPIWHHRQDRVQAHILFSFLAYAMWKTLQQWAARSGLGHSPRPIVEELSGIKLNDVILPTSTGRSVRLRCVGSPNDHQKVLLSRLGMTLPTRLAEPHWLDESAAEVNCDEANVVPNSPSKTPITAHQPRFIP